jgi:hypothetical protein
MARSPELSPGFLAGVNRPRVAMTTWETTTFPDEYARAIAEGYNGMIVPSRFCASVISHRPDPWPITAPLCPIRIVPHTFDPDVWLAPNAWNDPKAWLPDGELEPSNILRFYSIGAWGERKNHLATIRAYLHAFGAGDRVRLTIRSHGADYQAIRSILGRSGLAPADLPALDVDHVPMDDRVLFELHGDNDVYVSASRGEGWGLPMFEAALLGKAIITPVCSGERDFLEYQDDRSWWCYSALRRIRHTRTPAFAGPGTLEVRDGKVATERMAVVPGMTCRQLWAEPDVADIADRMRSLYAQHVHGYRFAGNAGDYEHLRSRFGYDVVATALATALQEIVTS